MSMLDLLLAADANALTDTPTAEFEVSRLSKILGGTFTIRVHALTLREFDSLPKGDDFKTHVLLAAACEPDFRSRELAEKLLTSDRKTPLTPVEVINRLLLPGEIVNLYNEIADLSGFGSDAVERIEKN